ncbi:DNA glycosylase [Paenarthrobacter sp. PH39-S1]|uniref:Fpg/Nei family DNA glycosylase n=1 Tax=Paenarthrobacter sp. PH39-S1 TaxID=3046204 RepID=UPI0024BBC90E|nr:DNA glycosylase [Paenarthrobacter sp. PH39-S1]MDJ0357001.1 zinc finger domain-containing protein [Paenarthrobacter sp. PH39-S1]
MPEGHSVHRLARQFQDVFAGHRLRLSSPQGRFTAGAARLDGHVLEHAAAHGKQLFLSFGNELVLRVHLGLYGAWDFGGDESFTGASSIGAPRRIGEREIPAADAGAGSVGTSAAAGRARSVGAAAAAAAAVGMSAAAGRARSVGAAAAAAAAVGMSAAAGRARSVGAAAAVAVGSAAYAGPPEPKGAVRVRLVSDHGWADLRGPTACEVLTPVEAAAAVAALGPDPLHNRPGDELEFIRRAGASRAAVGLLLMNQQVLAGVGNVYRAEVLFRRRLDPWLPGTALPSERLAGLWRDILSVMGDGVRDGRIITTASADRTSPTLPVAVGDAHYVYKREGLPCRICRTPVAMTELGNRKLYWCPACQC